MSIDESQVTAALAAVVDPELRRPLGELGMVGPVQVKRKRVAVEVGAAGGPLPAGRRAGAPCPCGGRAARWCDEVTVSQAVMDEEPRARLRMLLRGEPVGGDAAERPRPRPCSRGPARPRGGSTQPVHAASFEDPDPRDLLGQGGCRQVVGHGQPGRRPGPDGPRRRHPRRRRLRVLGPEDARRDVDPLIIGDLVVPPTANGVRCLSMGYFVPDDTPVIWRGPDAPQGTRAVPRRRLLG